MSRGDGGAGAWMTLLTAEGRGAVAVVRVWGEDALAVVARALRLNAGPTLEATPRGRLRVGRIGSGAGDEVVVVRDGDGDGVEVQCHGGMQAVGLVLAALEGAGASRAGVEAWLEETSAGRPEAQAWRDLSRAPTLRAAEILLEQAQGALRAEVLRLAGSAERGHSEEAARGIGALLDRARVGLRLIDGWRVVLAGRPNVGKSQLLNALAGYDRAIVDPTAGTTRDVVTVRTALAGWPVEVCDTAGRREPDDPLEAAGIARGEARRAGADLVVLVLDRSEPLGETDRALRESWPSALVVANKADRESAWSEAGGECLAVSALRGDGIAALTEAIGARLVPEPPGPGAGVPFRREHVEILEGARSRLAERQGGEAARRLRRWVGGGETTETPG